MRGTRTLGRGLRAALLGMLLVGGVLAQDGIGEGREEDLSLSKGRFGDAFLSGYDGPYLNFGWIDYENYRQGIPIFKSYDAFGNYLTEGYEVYRMEEYRAAPEDGSTVFKARPYENWLRHLIISDDAYGAWSTRVMVGDAIRTTFTPLTLDLARFNGIRWDEASPNNRFSLVLSRISDPLKLNLKARMEPGGVRRQADDGVYLLGGHWESRVGDFLVLGGTYLNMRRFDAGQGYTTNNRRGLAPPFTVPKALVVRIEDDSPESPWSGAAVFDVRGSARIRENGEERLEEIAAAMVERSAGVVEGPRHLEVAGRYADRTGTLFPEYVDYVFEVPDSTVGVTFSAVVANDYRIVIRQDHRYTPPSGSAKSLSTEFMIVRRAEGNVADFSNKRRVEFEHGMQTGLEIVGINAAVTAGGLRIRGEVARSSNYLQYAAQSGSRDDFEDFAAYVTVEKDLPGLSLGLEAFSVGPKYNTYAVKSLARQAAEAQPDPGVGVVELPREIQSDPRARTLGTPFFFNTAVQDPAGRSIITGGDATLNPIYALVDDNDDVDQWPDDWVEDWDVENRGIKYLESDAGILPFMDFDADGFPDNNRNRNLLVDSDEPFLMYFTDPQEFYFGDDFNNNSVLDAWEDDDQPNYPYYKDERGIHAVASFEIAPGVRVSVGRYDVEQIAGGGRNESTYGRVQWMHVRAGGWLARYDHESKAVKDDIPNPRFSYGVVELSDGRLVPRQHFIPDRLEARDSFVNRGLVHVRCSPGKYSNLDAKLRYEFNDQQRIEAGDGVAQARDDVDFLGFVFKADHAHHRGRLALLPRLKLQYRRQERSSVGQPLLEDLMIAPILRIDCQMTPRSQIRLGIQGLPLLVDRRIDFRDRDLDSDRRSYIVTWFHSAGYQGYELGTEAGVEFQSIDFDVRGRSDESYVRYFVRMTAGVGSVR